jgi:hypothetical protein
LIESVRENLRTNRSDCYTGSTRVRVRENARTKWCTKAAASALLIFRIVVADSKWIMRDAPD